MADITDDAYRARRPHRKSRFGCKNCKSRKIKCDEEKPQCGQCTKHAVVCDFSTRESVPASSVSSSNTTAATSGINSALLNPETPTGTPPISHDDEAWHWRRLLPSDFDLASASSLNIATNNPIEPQLELNMTDLELLHHFTVTTAYTLSTAPELQTWWRIEVPHIAFSYPFVMRALLSLSGIHVAHTLRSSSSSADNTTTTTSPPSAIHPSLFPSASSSFSSSSVTSSSHNNNNHNLPEERRLKAADHISRALSQRDLALRTAHAVLPNCTTTITADGMSTSLSLNPHIFPPLYVCAALTTLIAFASQRPLADENDSTAATPTDDPNDLLLLTIGDSNNNGPGAIAPWLRLSRDIKHAVDSVVAAEAGGDGSGGGDNNIFNTDNSSNISSRNRTTLLMSNAVGMPLRITRSQPCPQPPPPQSPSPSPPPPPTTTTTTPGGTFALRYDPCYGWSNGHSPGDDYGNGNGTGTGNSGNGDDSRASSSRPPRRTSARETDPAVAAGTEELCALRRWFVALYEQRYQHIGSAATPSLEEDIAAAAEAAADKADLASLCAAIDALVESYAAFDGGGGGGGGGGGVVDSEDDMTVGMRAILGWACNGVGSAGAGVDERFLERATQRAPAFLVVLAFWGVMVHWVDGGGGNSSGEGGLGRQGGQQQQQQQQQRRWWIGGWGKRLVGRVEAAVSEQEAALEGGGGWPDGGGSEVEDEVKRDWRRWLRWPLEQVGTEGERGRVRAVDCVVI